MSDTTEQILIPVLRVVNPFDVRDCVHETLVWERSKTLAEYFPLGMTEHVMSVNGKPVEPEDMAVTYLDSTDSLVMCPIPLGGGSGGGKGILRIVALIAVAYFTAGAGSGWLVGADSLTGATGIAASAIGIGASLAGGLLINALMPVATPGVRNNSGDVTSSSPSYGIDGAKNTSAEGISVPICYGGFRMGGNVLDLYVENVGSTQILYMLLNAGEGPVASLDELRINDRPITDYKNVQVDVRGGYSTQDSMPWFSQSITPHSVNQRLVNGEYVTYQTTVIVDRLRFDLVFPQGLGGVDSKTGNRFAVDVPMRIEVRKQGTSNWITCGNRQSGTSLIYHYTLPSVQTPTYLYGEFSGFTNAPSTEIVTTTSPTGYNGAGPTSDSAGNGYSIENYKIYLVTTDENGTSKFEIGYVEHSPIFTPGVDVNENSSVALRRSFYTPDGLAPGIYDVRATRDTVKSTSQYIADDVYITDINEILLDNISFVNTALVGIRVQLDDQLSGVPTVTFRNSGVLIIVWDKTTNTYVQKTSKNPAWIALDALTNKRYGAAMPYSSFDMEKFKQWAEFCDLHDLTFEGVIDTVMNVWDAIASVLRCGRAQIINIGTRFTVVIEGPALPTMMFGVGNIIEGSFKQTWLSVADRANEIDVTFYDRADNYKQRSIKVIDQQAIETGQPQRPASITLPGIVDKEKAYREGFFQLNLNRYILQTIEFSAPMDAIACTVGDLVYVQHDMPEWGFAGRTETGSTASNIVLDRNVLIEPDKQYKLLLKHDAIRRSTGSILSVVGDSLVISGWNGQGRVTRIQTGGKDRAVLSTFDAGGGNFGVVVEGDTYTAGVAIELWDTDVIEERDVVAVTGSSPSLTVMSPFSVAPGAYVNFMFGEVSKIKKPFRVKMVSGNHDYKRHLTLIEYNASCYDFSGMAVPTPNYSSLPSTARQVTIDGVTEAQVASGSGFVSVITVGFHSSSQSYTDSTVKASVNGGPFKTIAVHANQSADMGGQYNDIIVFKVIANDGLGGSAIESAAPTISYTVIGRSQEPGIVNNFNRSFVQDGILLSWSKPTEPDWEKTTIRVGSTWNAGTEIFGQRQTSFLLPFENTAGTKTYWARNSIPFFEARSDASVDVVVNAPSTVVFRQTNIAGSASTIKWNDSQSSQRLQRYVMRVGTTSQAWADLTSFAVVSGNSNTHTIIFDTIGVKRVWVVAEDAGGIQSTPSYTDVTVVNTVDLTPPPTPTGVVTDTAITTVFIDHDVPTYTMGHKHNRTKVYGVVETPSMPNPVFANAKVVHEFTGITSSFSSDPSTTWHLWVTWVTNDGVESTTPAGGGTGFIATTGRDPAKLIKVLTGKLKEEQLFIDLGNRINLIDGSKNLTGSVNNRVSIEATDRSAIDDIIIAATKVHASINRVNVTNETDNRVAALLDEATQRQAAITTESTIRQTADLSLADRITTVTASVGVNAAAIQDETTARVTANTATATQINVLAARVTTNEGGISTNAAAITTERLARVDAVSSVSSAITALTATVAGNESTSTAALITEASARATADSAESTSRLALASRVTTAEGAITTNGAAITSEASTRATAIDALGTNLNTLNATVSSNLSSLDARITDEQTVRATQDTATASQISTLSATVSTNNSTITAALQTEATVRADETGVLSGKYSVKVDLNGYVTGYGLSATANNATPTSSFVVRADNFYIGSPSGPGITPTIPFIVRTTPTVINGETVPVGTYMNDVYIQNGTITNEKVGNSAITNAKISDLRADKITTASLAVGTEIYSPNWSYGVSGWLISADGNAYFNTVNVRGSFNSGGFTDYNWPAGGIGGSHLSGSGLLLGNYSTGKYFQVTSAGDIFAPGFSVSGGTLTVNQANVINTGNIVNNSISRSHQFYAAANSVSSGSIQTFGRVHISAIINGTDSTTSRTVTIKRDGAELVGFVGALGQYTLVCVDEPTPGSYTYTVDGGSAIGNILMVMLDVQK